MYKIFTLLVLICYGTITIAQVSNVDFESWEDSGKPAPFDWKQPTGWISTNSLTEWTAANVKQYQPAFDGDYSLQLMSINIGGGWPTVVCNGEPDLISDFTAPGIDIITGGEPINYQPLKVSGQYHFDGENDDKGYGVVILKKYNQALLKYDTLGLGEIYFTPNAAFEQFEININYITTVEMPDSIVVAFYSTDPENPKGFTGGKKGLLIDNIEVGSPLAICDCTPVDHGLILAPNPVKDRLELYTNGSNRIETVSIYTMHGVKVRDEVNVNSIDLSDLANGYYIVEAKVDNNFIVKQFIKQ